jgi:hypothetical protein
VCEDYQRYVVQILVDQAANLMTTQSVHTSLDTFAKRQESLGEKATWPTFEWHIVGQEDNFFYLEIDADHDVNEEPTWKPRSFVERVLPAQLKSWDLFDPAKKAAVFQAWLQQQRTKGDASFWFPRQIHARHIQTAVRMLIPGELSKHGMAVMLTATIRLLRGTYYCNYYFYCFYYFYYNYNNYYYYYNDDNDYYYHYCCFP